MDILPQLLLNSLISGSIYALASAGLSMTYGLLRILNFAHGHLMMVGAYFLYLFHIQLGYGLVSASVGVLLATCLLAWISLRIFILPFTPYNFFLTFVTTLSLSTILESLVSIIFGVNVKSLAIGYSVSSIEFWGLFITPVQILIIASASVLLSLLAFVVHFTMIGRKIRALAEHSHAAEALGTSKVRVSTIAFIIASLLAAYAGVMVGYETNIPPTMGSA